VKRTLVAPLRPKFLHGSSYSPPPGPEVFGNMFCVFEETLRGAVHDLMAWVLLSSHAKKFENTVVLFELDKNG